MSTNSEEKIPATADHADDGQGQNDSPLAVTHAEMNAAYEAGEAIPLAASMSWLIRYQDSWWVVYERGWLRVTDTATAEDLDQAAARLSKSEGT